MKPFAHNTALLPQQKDLIMHMDWNAFEARWQRLMKRNDMDVQM